ncbi:hypothetical protein EMCRGX_G029279 [Ephydatia muelleri]
MFGRKAIMPIDMETSTKISAIDNEVSSTDIEMLAKQWQKIISMIKETILEAQKRRQKYVYDRKHANPNYFTIGELVLMKDFRRKRRAGGKLDSKYVGPYTITKILGKGYYVQHVENPESTVTRVSGIHLKPYCTPVKKGNDSCTREKRKNTCIKGQPEVVDLDKIDSDRVWEQLNSPSLMGVWRTGADELCYDAHEDDEYLIYHWI